MPVDNASAMTCDVALIGFGEAGHTFARAGGWGPRASGYDILSARRAALAGAGLTSSEGPGGALGAAPLVLSLVTADQALRAALDYSRFLIAEAIWCDANSVAPETKRKAAAAVEAAGGRFVDVAILAPVEPSRLDVPLLLSGPAAGDALGALNQLGFRNVRVVGREVGRASAIKMIRSVMVKGIEALTAEMMLAAGAAGVTEEVLASLDASEKQQSWVERAAYNLERMTAHGARRAAEMEESARTLTDLGVVPLMTEATARRQREMANKSHARSAAA